MPTYNRRAFVPNAIEYFLRQDYKNKELIILDDGADVVQDLVPNLPNIRYFNLGQKITLGAKLNLACEYAKGDIIATWDDDDWYANWRLIYQVDALQEEGVELCGINNLIYYDLVRGRGYEYVYPKNRKVWLSGSSLCFKKRHWEKNRFADINVGMDGLFAWATPRTQIRALENNTYSVLFIHGKNISPKKTEGAWWSSFPSSAIKSILGDDWSRYQDHAEGADASTAIAKRRRYSNLGTSRVRDTVHKRRTESTPAKKLVNVFACLVHEKYESVLDLVRNLRYQDPDSLILLYNGGNNRTLLRDVNELRQYNAFVHPEPSAQEYGRLHGFAVDCMNYAIKHFNFDLITIVDSDQLLIKPNYSEYISKYLSGRSRVGMLTSSTKQYTKGNSGKNYVVGLALQEYKLWEPFLNEFINGKDCFAHWTFWPSSVITKSAAIDIVDLFNHNTELHKILRLTRIFATEEIVFPTLVRLLGYDILASPCDYEYVKYKVKFHPRDFVRSVHKEEAYWMHPIDRDYYNSLRKEVRGYFNSYGAGEIKENNHSKNMATVELNRSVRTRTEIINYFFTNRNYSRYLEIGVNSERSNFNQIKSKHKVGVDPKPVSTYAGTSDEFFQQNKETFDVIFIDGLHTEEQVAKDIASAKKCLSPAGVIVIHDCMPPTKWHQRELSDYVVGESWNGTVWKAVLREFNRSKSKCYVINVDWGCGVIDFRYKQQPLDRKLPEELDFDQHYFLLNDYKLEAAEFPVELSPINKETGVSFVLIAYNNSDKLKQRLEREVFPTAAAYPNYTFQLIIIDNSYPCVDIDLRKIKDFGVTLVYLQPTKNLMYGPSINLALEHAAHEFMVYLCTNHGRMNDTTWLQDILDPLVKDPKAAMTGSTYPSCPPSKMGFSTHLPHQHIQGGIFAAKTEILRKYSYTSDSRWIHGGSDIYQSYRLMEAGYKLVNVPSIKSVWRRKVPHSEKYKYVHDESE